MADMEGLPNEVVSELEAIERGALESFAEARDLGALEQARVAALGLKGQVTKLFERLQTIPKERRKAFGQRANRVKTAVEEALAKRKERIEAEALERELTGERLDVTLPGRVPTIGRRHPVSRTLDEITLIFSRLGFEVASGPEIELDFFNFQALNVPADHPARDMQDTFYLDPASLGPHFQGQAPILRTHTSPVQVRTMVTSQPPIRVIVPGKVYRCDSDMTHTPMFHQVEGLLVDENVTMAELKGTLDAFVIAFFGSKTKTRFRPSYFPFTEPSAEVDVSCVHCAGAGCRLCKGTGWLEVLGSGMVHPNVFRAVGYDPARITGFAFGMGVERLTLLRYGIDDLRTLFDNDVRFLEQF